METSYETPSGVRSALGEPTWEVAHFFPLQGEWTEEQFFSLPTPHQFELDDGRLEALPMPTWIHVLIQKALLRRLWAYLDKHKIGEAGPAPLFVRLWSKQIRQPDIVYCSNKRIRDKSKTQDGADLVMEIVSPGEANRERDLVLKRKLYAKAGILEYWIADPKPRTITVFKLAGTRYRKVGEYREGDAVSSIVLPGFTVNVQEVFAVLDQ